MPVPVVSTPKSMGAPNPDCAVTIVDICQPSSRSLVNPDELLKNGTS